MIADCDGLHTLAHLDDLARALVSENGRSGLRQGPVHRRQVGVAHPRRMDLHLDLAGTGIAHLHVVVVRDLFLTCGVEYRSAHGNPLVVARL